MSTYPRDSSLLTPRGTSFPRMYACRQQLYAAPLGDEGTVQAVRAQFAARQWAAQVAGGKSVAIGCGSRGIDRIDLIVKTLVELVKEAGGQPFVFPAMGSHGAATDEGQTAVLATLGVTQQSIGCPIKSSMETVSLGSTDAGVPVYQDKQASGADAILVVNRVKPHTNFVGHIESGLMKMLAIGMGKADQASAIHAHGVSGLRDHMPAVARVVLEKSPVLGGLAILEDALHQVCRIDGVTAESLEQEEQRLLAECRPWQAALPVKELDLLIIDEIGKEVSGTGMDAKVVGRCRLLDFHAFAEP
ncbi:MAG: lactate racemase domain-containing protein, partial [Planctomycetota bacterium]|nr:lactate racemase domain-containing protein [Planctomycetota bacterium]